MTMETPISIHYIYYVFHWYPIYMGNLYPFMVLYLAHPMSPVNNKDQPQLTTAHHGDGCSQATKRHSLTSSQRFQRKMTLTGGFIWIDLSLYWIYYLDVYIYNYRYIHTYVDTYMLWHTHYIYVQLTARRILIKTLRQSVDQPAPTFSFQNRTSGWFRLWNGTGPKCYTRKSI